TTATMDKAANGWIEDLVSGNYSIEKRILIKVDSDIVPDGFYPFGFNEFAIHHTGTSMLRISISINNLSLPPYWADGVSVSTPTGSTAYSLSVGGPIVTPDSNVLILSPVAPHNLNVRPIVAPADSVIEVSFASKEEGALVTLDNRSFNAPAEGRFTVSKADYCANCVRLRNSNFINALRDKLLWGEDRRNTI
ncbi:MAG: NAD(+)/NADH kinase, partial [Bacteroidales bacterium]|nr:NAD(+)/NADH kinase [Bacteroidales bacterium]